jgi:hypothetical protein
MLIYGSRSSHLKSVQLNAEVCPHCQTQGSVIVSTYAKYAHIFWIPLFPLGRVSVSQCQHCKQVLEDGKMPAQIKQYHQRNIAETRIPIWQFAGLVIIALTVVAGIYNSKVENEKREAFLQNPNVGDIYHYKTGPSAYTTFKIVGVGADTLEVNFNNYEVDKITGIYKIEKDENYSDSVFLLPKASIQEMFAGGDILDINR